MYLYGTKQCHFAAKHYMTYALGKELASVRGFAYPSEIEVIIADAMLELKDDWKDWGPYKLEKTGSKNHQFLRLLMDGQTVLDAEICPDRFTLLYLKDFGGNLTWMNEIAGLAEAHWRNKKEESKGEKS